jgi:hypothetical protein
MGRSDEDTHDRVKDPALVEEPIPSNANEGVNAAVVVDEQRIARRAIVRTA